MSITARAMMRDTIGVLSKTQDSSANTAQTLSVAAVSGYSHFLSGFEVAISGADAAADVTIQVKDGTTVIWKTVIGSGAARGERVGIALSRPIQITEGAALSIEVSAGGAGCVSHLNMEYFSL